MYVLIDSRVQGTRTDALKRKANLAGLTINEYVRTIELENRQMHIQQQLGDMRKPLYVALLLLIRDLVQIFFR